MALPDPLTLTSSQEAFTHHPLPAIRQLSHQLHHHLDTNRAQLRSLVGASYRDLLGTAERIVEMDVQIRAVEGELGGWGGGEDGEESGGVEGRGRGGGGETEGDGGDEGVGGVFEGGGTGDEEGR
ncbi:hypothetical protein LTS09_011893 [Friedmanniomyces endolithicus]|nr:hypothetical protein LTS09_011893 [Friedmanniomyces endolithicus]